MAWVKRHLTEIIIVAVVTAGVVYSGVRDGAFDGTGRSSSPPAPVASGSSSSGTPDGALTPYGFNPNRLALGVWQVPGTMKDGILGDEGCSGIRQTEVSYVPVSFDEGARCGIMRDGDVVYVYGVGYRWAYEGERRIGAAIYTLREDGFVVETSFEDLPDLDTVPEDRQAALDGFAETHDMGFGSDAWDDYALLNVSLLKEELEEPSVRVMEAFEGLKALVESRISG